MYASHASGYAMICLPRMCAILKHAIVCAAKTGARRAISLSNRFVDIFGPSSALLANHLTGVMLRYPRHLSRKYVISPASHAVVEPASTNFVDVM
jgi:hypothetical protein